jgi:hypothetical protein
MHLLEPGTPQWCWLRLYGKDDRGGYVSKERGAKVRSDGSFAVDGVPPGRYEVSIGAMYRRTDTATGWDTRMFVHDTELDVGPTGLRGVLLRPRPRPPKPPEQAPLPAAAPRPDAEQEPEAKPQTEAKQEPEAKPKRQAQRQH